MTLNQAYNTGAMTALVRYKMADAVLGARHGVQPPGDTLSSGTALIPYAGRPSMSPTDPAAQAKAKGAVDDLWNLSDIDHLAPGLAGGYSEQNFG